jgi:CO dehydrogenase maturation factor
MDNEAGLEHISRRTTQDIDYLFIISDNSVRSIRSAGRAYKLVKQIKTNVKKVYLIITRATDEELEKMKSEIEKTELELAGIIPDDKLVKEFDIEGKALYDLPDDSKAVIAVEKILKEKLKGQV